MMNWIKSMDLEQMKDQMADMKEQIQDLRFRKPWSRGEDPSPILFMALGAALAWTASAIYRNRTEVADFCSTCGARIKQGWDHSGLKDKAGKVMGRAKESAMASPNGQEPLY